MRVILTGGPGAGKTTLLQALAALGHPVGEDSAREIIRERRDLGLPPRPPAVEFAEAILARDLAQYVARPFAHPRQASGAGPCFFDRGIPDALAMLVHAQPERHDELVAFARRHPYHPTVFCLPPWEAIYVQDAERDHPFEHARRVHDAAQAWYRALGYTVVGVPEGTVEERVRHVLDALA